MPVVEAGTKFVPHDAGCPVRVPAGRWDAGPACEPTLPSYSPTGQRDTLTELCFASYFLGDLTLDFQRRFCFPVSRDRTFPQIRMLRLNAQGDGVRRWVTWGVVMRVEPSSVPLELFIEEAPERAPAPSTLWGHRERVTVREEESSHLTPSPQAPRSWTCQSPDLSERNVCC